jgi:hypothetical protein
MKVELLINLKIGSGQIISAGTVFSDEFEPIPEFIMNRLRRGTAKVIADNKKITPPEKSGGKTPTPTSSTKEEKVTTFKARTVEKEKSVVAKPKKALLKKETPPEG